MEIEQGWLDLLASIAADSSIATIYVVGEVDTGKTSLARFLLSRLTVRYATAYLDCDCGQSVVGPPATVGISLFAGGNPEAQHTYLRFVGNASPKGHLLQTVVGLRRLLDRAHQAGAQKIVIDSSGFATGEAGREFQYHVIDVLQPDCIAVLNGATVGPVLSCFRGAPKIIELPVSTHVVPRDAGIRRDYRRKRFERFFRDATLQELTLEGFGLRGRVPDFARSEQWQHLLFALCGSDQFVVTLAVMREVAADSSLVRFHAPQFDRLQVASLQFGSMYLEQW